MGVPQALPMLAALGPALPYSTRPIETTDFVILSQNGDPPRSLPSKWSSFSRALVWDLRQDVHQRVRQGLISKLPEGSLVNGTQCAQLAAPWFAEFCHGRMPLSTPEFKFESATHGTLQIGIPQKSRVIDWTGGVEIPLPRIPLSELQD